MICSFQESSNVSTIERHSDFDPLKTEFGKSGLWSCEYGKDVTEALVSFA